MSVTGSNYSVALKILTDRYQNLNILVRSHIDALFKVEKVRKECPRELTSLVGDFENNLGILEKLGENTKGWSSLLVFMVSARLDHNTLREWQRAADKKRMPTYDELITFIREYVMELETLQSDRPACDSIPVPLIVNAGTTVQPKDNCAACGMGHRLYFCDQFKQMPVTQRAAIVNEAGLCVNCLFGKHSFVTCKYGACRICGTKHHSLLHVPDLDTARESSINQLENQSLVSNSAGDDRTLPVSAPLSLSAHTHSGIKRLDLSPSNQVFLATAVVKVFGPKGTSFLARVLLDSASQPNLMTERFRRLLNSRKTPDNTEIAGIGGKNSAVSLFSTVATVASRLNNFRVPLQFIVLDKVTSDLPTRTADTSDWVIPENVRLADPSFATRGPIDMVIGARVFFELLRSGHSKLGEGKPMLQNSVFGWLVSGIHDCGSNESEVRVHCNLSTFHDPSTSVNKKVQTYSTLSGEERLCYDYFESRTSRNYSSLPNKLELIGQLSQPSIPRLVFGENGFADSSLRAFDACIHLRSISLLGAVKTRLLSASFRLANSFATNQDSQIRQLNEFVTWLHVPTENDPAGHISRGLTTESIVGNGLLCNGPKWLLRIPQPWLASGCTSKSLPSPEVYTEKRKSVFDSAVCIHPESWIRETFGNLDNSSVLRILFRKLFINATRPYDRKNPCLIQNFVVNPINLDAHEELLCAGYSHLLAAVRRYCLINGPNKTRNTVHIHIVKHHLQVALVVLQTQDKITLK
ncbi:uncharacterized protein LOC129743163 [Uranotaenia lowii]|uniref:uncharacterized protein LOC129743163 n=1 Tax=Uranotaenia lowii TaxID=190385 RepID=UPI0024788783|nr:uncharacterized protein LOC129743163 [Uranotaenia lowii]